MGRGGFNGDGDTTDDDDADPFPWNGAFPSEGRGFGGTAMSLGLEACSAHSCLGGRAGGKGIGAPERLGLGRGGGAEPLADS